MDTQQLQEAGFSDEEIKNYIEKSKSFLKKSLVKTGELGLGTLETAGKMAEMGLKFHPFIAAPTMGLRGLGEILPGKLGEKATGIAETIEKPITVVPQTEIGKGAAEKIEWPFKKLEELGEGAADYIREKYHTKIAIYIWQKILKEIQAFIDYLITKEHLKVYLLPFQNFKDNGTEDINYGRPTKEAFRVLPKELHRKAQIKLARLGAATSMQDLQEIRGNRFEKLKGDRQGQYSIRINEQYRICFKWEKENAVNVEIADYH